MVSLIFLANAMYCRAVIRELLVIQILLFLAISDTFKGIIIYRNYDMFAISITCLLTKNLE